MGHAHLHLSVRGMDCADEAALIRRALGARDGVGRVDFDLVNGRVEVDYDPAIVTPEAIRALIDGTGLTVLSDGGSASALPGHGHDHPHHDHVHDSHDRAGVWTAISGAFIAAGWVIETLGADHWVEGLVGHGHDPRASVLYAVSAVAGLWPMWPRALASLRHRHLDMHVLVCLSVAGAAAIGEWSEGAAVAFLFGVAHRMEAWSLEHARTALVKLAAGQSHDLLHGMHRPAPMEQWIERFGAIYTPFVTAGAAAVAVLPAMVDGQWGTWFYRALVFLVLACPCALVISTPVTVVAAVASAARRGVLIKGGAPLERASQAVSDSSAAFASAGVTLARAGDPLDVLDRADVVVGADEARDRAFLRAHARRALFVIRQNVGVALATKLAFLAFASIGAAPLWMAVLADTGATVAVTLNGLRLLRTGYR